MSLGSLFFLFEEKMNFIFISPNFPYTYWNFCDRLKQNGVNVLGIGDSSYDALNINLKNSLTEYYKVDSLQDYDQVFKAVAFFSFKYGKIDWIESNNEFWLEQDARLRTDFNINTGIKSDKIANYKSKYQMKEFYRKAGVPVARIQHVTTIKKAQEFVKLTGYPVFAKPEIGVGATDTFKITNDEELQDFFNRKPDFPYVIEEFVTGDICSYDAIVDNEGNPLFESMTIWPPSVADIVKYQLDLMYYTASDLPAGLRRLGRAAVKAFEVQSRFVHLEFFRLSADKPGLGKKGSFVGLEVNMRPAGGYTPDMMNWAHSTDVYQIWADMVTSNKRLLPDSNQHQYCVFASRRDIHDYVHSHEEIMERYGDKMLMCERMPDMMAPQMGNQMYTAYAADLKKTLEFIKFVHQQK